MKKSVFQYTIIALLVLLTVAAFAAPAAAAPTMTRTVSPMIVTPGDTFHVTLELNDINGTAEMNTMSEIYDDAAMSGWTISNIVVPSQFDNYPGEGAAAGTYDFGYLGSLTEFTPLPAGDYVVEYDITVDAGTTPGMYDLVGLYQDSIITTPIDATGSASIAVAAVAPTVLYDDTTQLIPGEINITAENDGTVFTWNTTTDAGALVASGINFTVNNSSSLGMYITSIGGIDDDYPTGSWAIFINGAYASMGLGQNNLEGGDIVTFINAPYNATSYEFLMDQATHVVNIPVTTGPEPIYDGAVTLTPGSLVVNASGTDFIIDAESGAAALDATGLSYTAVAYSWGLMYTEIDGIASGAWPEGSGWSVYKNGAYSMVGLTDMMVEEGDYITLYYASYYAIDVPAEATYMVNITIAEMVDPSIDATVLSGDAPLEVGFDSTLPFGAVILQWDFDDGITTMEETPTHIFTAPGTYEVVLLYGIEGETESYTVTTTITVTGAGNGAVFATRTIEQDEITTYGDRRINVTVEIGSNYGVNAPTFQEFIPEGWILTPTDNDGAVYKEETLEWVWTNTLNAGDTKVVTYTLTIPEELAEQGVYRLSGIVYAYNIDPVAVDGEYMITMQNDWNPWDDPDSIDGAIITTVELQEAINCWLEDEPAPKTGAEITTERLQYLIDAWLTA